jgi:hypothetical protein
MAWWRQRVPNASPRNGKFRYNFIPLQGTIFLLMTRIGFCGKRLAGWPRAADLSNRGFAFFCNGDANQT